MFLGKKMIKIFGFEYSYEGETDQGGLACGEGVAIHSNGNKYTGTFYNDLLQGICK